MMSFSDENYAGSGILTWKWLGTVLLSIVFFIVGMMLMEAKTKINDVQITAETHIKENFTRIEGLRKEKLDKDVYYRDVAEIKTALTAINDKLDRIKR